MQDLYASLFKGQPSKSFQDVFFAQNPNLAYRQRLQQGNVDPYSQFGRFAGSQFGNLYADYSLSAVNRGPEYSFSNFLDESGGVEGVRKRWRGMPDQERGLNLGAYQGKNRWVL